MTQLLSPTGDIPEARREAQRVDLIRRAAGVDALIGQGMPGHHFGRFLCLHCPDDRYVPPYRPLRLESHILEHLRANPGHEVRFYCFDDAQLEDQWLPPPTPWEVLAALEIVRRAGLLKSAVAELSPPEPDTVLLTYCEVETLKAIRERPGTTMGELRKASGLSQSTIESRVRLLRRGGHVRAEGEGRRGKPRHLYPTHDRPLAKVRPRAQVNWRQPRQNETSAPEKAERGP